MAKNDNQEYALSEVPKENRKSFLSLIWVLLGFTFFTATMYAGASIGRAFTFWDILLIVLIGNILLGIYVAILGYIAQSSGLNTTLMSRYSFGDFGSRWVDLILGFTQIGWYGWGVATVAVVILKIFGFSETMDNYTLILNLTMIFFGVLFGITAYIGYRGIQILSAISVPLMIIFMFISLYYSFDKIGGIEGLTAITPSNTMTFGIAITAIIGTFISGGTQSTNWTRFAKTKNNAVLGVLIAFFIGNGLMVLTGAIGAMVYDIADIVDVMLVQGLVAIGALMLLLNIWTTQDNTIYNFAAAGCTMFRTPNRKLVTIIGIIIGTILGILRVDQSLFSLLILLGTFIPPIGGIIIADFFINRKQSFTPIETTKFVAFNFAGIAAYIIASTAAYYGGFMPPVTGVIVAFFAYIILIKINKGE